MVKWFKNLLRDARRYRWLRRHVLDYDAKRLKLCVTFENKQPLAEWEGAGVSRFEELLDKARRDNPRSPDQPQSPRVAMPNTPPVRNPAPLRMTVPPHLYDK